MSTGHMRVLVVEDDAVLAEAIARGLRRHGMSVDVAVDGERAFTYFVSADGLRERLAAPL